MTRARLINAAVEAFAARGYVATTVDDIAERAQATRATFYRHFSTKGELLPELLSQSEAHFTDLYSRLADLSAEPTVEDVQSWLLAAMDEWAAIADVVRPLFEAAASDPTVHAQLYPEGAMPYVALTEAIKESHGISAEEAAIYANVIIAPLSHYFQMFLRGIDFDRELVTRVIATAWVAVVSAH